MNEIKIFVIDDHKIFVEGICSLLSDEKRFALVGCSNSGHEFLTKYLDYDIDVYLIDINMPELSGVELTKYIIEKKPSAKILALTMHEEFEYVERMIKSGASGYVLKSAGLNELSVAIEQVARGNKFFGIEIQEMMFNKLGGKNATFDSESKNHQPTLTKREIEILSLIAKEYTTSQIAEMLYISERTVETHRKNIFSKTKARSIIGLSKFAIQYGYISLDNSKASDS
jgi:DNA-binding NarL/FixJ family response regulator